MYVFKRNQDIQLSKNFVGKEFQCQCGVCEKQYIHTELVNKLQKIRDEFGQALIVTSAYRCRKHQAAIRGSGIKTAKGMSTHQLGAAVDIRPANLTADSMIKLLDICEKYFEAIGIANNFIHVDLRVGRKRRWDY